MQERQLSATRLQRWGGAAALYEALAYIIGIIGFLAVVNVAEIADPVERIAAMGEFQSVLSLLYVLVYVLFGAALVVLTLALYHRLDGSSSPLVQTATIFGFIWAGLVIAAGMIYNMGMAAVVTLSATDPGQAASAWVAIEAVHNGLGGGVEVVGGMWVLLLSIAALQQHRLSRALNYLGILVGAAGVVTMVPALSEIGGMVFGLTQIVWFAWMGFTLFRTRTEAKTTLTEKPAASSGAAA